MKRYHVTIRGSDSRGVWSLQNRLEAENPDDALTRTCEKWHVQRGSLTRIHVQEDDGRAET